VAYPTPGKMMCAAFCLKTFWCYSKVNRLAQNDKMKNANNGKYAKANLAAFNLQLEGK
jgi:hypothetical protein